jgi:hypothetical protein
MTKRQQGWRKDKGGGSSLHKWSFLIYRHALKIGEKNFLVWGKRTCSRHGDVKWDRVLTVREEHRLNVFENTVLRRQAVG